MTRILGLTLALILIVAPATRAQTVSAYPQECAATDYSGYFYGELPFGGFGFDYVQSPTTGGLVMDRFGMLHPGPRVDSPPPVAAERPRAAVQPTVTRTKSKRAAARPVHQLPTGSLSRGASNGVILYSPELRYETYGGGYARSPYGTNDYGSMYKGWPLGY
jgi:hypothetical protein